MAHLDPNEAFQDFRDRVFDGIRDHFPMRGKKQTLYLDGVEVVDNVKSDDLRAQHDARVNGKSFTVPVYGTMRLVDNDTGKLVDKKRVRLADLPKQTQRYSYLLEGKEYQIDNQWQLKPGAYTRRRQNGELETRFNVTGGRPFDITFDPESKKFLFEYNKAKLPLYPLLKTLGVDEDTLERELGKDIVAANREARGTAGTLEKFYKTDTKRVPESREQAAARFVEAMRDSKMRPEATAATLGAPHDHVNGSALLLSAKKLLKVQSGHPEDDRDSLLFKDLRAAGDFAHDKITASKKLVASKAARKLNEATDIRDILKFDYFNDPIRDAFKKNAAARLATQINPVEMVASSMQTTVMGPGGIQSEQQVVDETKFVNPSHLGYLDPITTPEGPKTGVTLRLPIGVRKIGHEVNIPLFNLKTGKTELVPPSTFLESGVVLPDQVTWKDGRPSPISKTVKMAGRGNDVTEGAFSEAQYVMRHPSQLFGITTNLIPFMPNTSGNRASMASRHMEQAISLVHREAPLVQVGTGVDQQGLHSFEQVLGSQTSHRAPVDGTVKSVKPGSIILRADDGKEHEVQTYNNYPLNDAKSVLHATASVSPGDRVKSGQVVADTNFSKGGTLALGTNLLAAFIPYKGYNFEDGVVISETAAKKLSSMHLHKHKLPTEDGLIFDRAKFEAQHPGAYKRDQLAHIGEDGLPKVGSRVKPGDPLVLATKKFDAKGRLGLNIARKSLSGAHVDKSLQWDGETEGEIVGVTPTKDEIRVHVRTVEPLQVGDKIAGRHGNKGVVAYILPDKEMPHLKDGRHVEVALNPSGVPGRMNVGQVLETVASKIAEKTGKPYVVPSFPHGVDMVEHVKGELKKHGLQDAEELHDPVTGQSLGKALVGKHHVLKLVHQVDKKAAVASGMAGSSSYDINLQPKDGQRAGALGVYALLAHGAKANLREMATWKGEGPDMQADRSKAWPSQHAEVWARLQTGQPLPTPKTTFAFKKFEALLKGAGVNIEKKGHEHILSPLTDKHVLEMTGDRALTKPAERLEAKADKATGELKPRPGGLFDPKLTGGHGGMLWSRIKLAEPVPNPVFEAPICALAGLSKKDFDAIMDGEKGVTQLGDLTGVGHGVLTGGRAIEHLLRRIDVPKELERAKSALTHAKGDAVDKSLKKVKYLQALDQLGMKAHEAYVLNHLPVIPPAMRPASLMADGNIKYADVNELYSQFAQVNAQLADPTLAKNLTEKGKSGLRANFYDGVKAIAGFGIPYNQADHKGLLHQIAGAYPKAGFFQRTLIQKRQDLTMRSTIIPEPALGLDEVGLPRKHALDLYEPFVVQKIQEMGVAKTPLDALEYVKSKKANPNAVLNKALEKAMADRPVLLKRDPALHKYSVQGFQPKVVEGNAIKIHPLVCGGFNADFDGDTMSVFVPIGREAVAEAHRMKPTNNLFSEASGRIAYQPTLEGALGLYKLSVVGKDSGKSFGNMAHVLEEARRGKLGHTDVVTVDGKKTTAGRVLLATALPETLHQKVLHDLDFRVDKKGLDKVLTQLGREHQKGDSNFDKHVNLLKDVGNGASFGSVALDLPHRVAANIEDPTKNVFIPIGTHSFTLDDFAADKEVRSRVLDPAHAAAEKVRRSKVSQAEKDRQVVGIYIEADKKMRKLHEEKLSQNPTNLFMMYQAGVKPGWDQYKQMVLAPMLLKNSADKIIPTPVTRSYSEGLDVAGYWTQMHGARRGSVMKVQEVQEPGYMSKLLMSNTMHLSIADRDCGTKRGVTIPLLRSDGKPELDVNDRMLATDHQFGDLHLPAGTEVTPELTTRVLRHDPKAALHVRSPLKCEHTHGICQHCMGLSSDGKHHDIGTNVGVMAAQTVGERSVQLTLKSFHTGGAVEQGGGKLLNSFARFEQLTKLPKTIPNAASLALQGGRVESIDHTPTGVNIVVGGRPHFVGKDEAGNPLHRPLPGSSWSGLKVGDHVEAGQSLSDPGRTYVNPHDLYRATKSIDRVHDHLATEIYDLYKDEGVKRRHVETVVRAMGGTTKVTDPGDAEGVLRGEFQPLAAVQKTNASLRQQGKAPIEHTPVLKGVDVLPLVAQEDWMGKLQHLNLRTTIADAAAIGAKSNLHGSHPVPGLAYGAEFGLNSSHAHKPGLAHLRDVAPHNY